MIGLDAEGGLELGVPLAPDLLKQERGKLAEAATPRLPFVASLGRDVKLGLDAGAFQRLDTGSRVATAARATVTKFVAAIADEDQLVAFLEGPSDPQYHRVRCCRH